MIDLFFQITLSNVFISLLLAIVATIAGTIIKRPVITHLLWLLVFLKLLTPPVLMISAIPISWLNEHTPPINLTINEQQDIQNVWVSEIADDTYPFSETGHMASIQGKHWLFLAWLLGSTVILIWSMLQVYRFHRLLKKESERGSPGIQSTSEEIAACLGLKNVPIIYTTSANVSPMVWWIGGKVWVVIPTALIKEMNAEQIRWILSHELAHVCRRDYMIRWIEWMCCVGFWWNPVTWWARHNLRANEELCCDALVLSSMKPKPYIYGDSLLRTIEILAYPIHCLPAIASGINNGKLLKRRISMIISKKLGRSNLRLLKACTFFGALIVLPIGLTNAKNSETVNHPFTEITNSELVQSGSKSDKPLNLNQGKMSVTADVSRRYAANNEIIEKEIETGEIRIKADKAEQIDDPGEFHIGNYIKIYEIYVLGKVEKPGMINPRKPVTVLQALALAGGLTEWANDKEIKVIRKKDSEQLVYNFNYLDIALHGRNLDQNITLLSGDVVVVP